MSMGNTHDHWGLVAQIFHWGIFVILVAIFTLGLTMEDVENAQLRGAFYGWHKQLGVTLLVLASLRLWWRMKNTVPVYPSSMPPLLKFGSKAGVHLLYFFMITIPLSGLMMSIAGGHNVNMFGLFVIPGFAEKIIPVAATAHDYHVLFVWVFLGVIGLHFLGALYHKFVAKDGVFERMWGKRAS